MNANRDSSDPKVGEVLLSIQTSPLKQSFTLNSLFPSSFSTLGLSKSASREGVQSLMGEKPGKLVDSQFEDEHGRLFHGKEEGRQCILQKWLGVKSAYIGLGLRSCLLRVQ